MKNKVCVVLNINFYPGSKMRCLLMAGLLTCPVFIAFPSRRQTSVFVTVAVEIKTLIHNYEPDLQQRELLQTYTAFPFNQ